MTEPQKLIFLIAALCFAVLLMRLALRPNRVLTGRAARVLGFISGAFLCLVMLIMAPYLTDLCREGLDQPITCPAVPVLETRLYSSVSLLVMVAWIYLQVPLLVLTALAELAARLLDRRGGQAQGQPPAD